MSSIANKGIMVGFGLVALIAVPYGIYRQWANDTHFDYNEDIDVTSKPDGRDGITPGATYYLPDGLYIAKGPERPYLEKPFPGESYPPSRKPKSREAYELSPVSWPEIIGFLSSNATFRVDRIYRHISFEYSNIFVLGMVTDGDKKYESVYWAWPTLERQVR